MSSSKYSARFMLRLAAGVALLSTSCSLIGGNDAVVSSELDAAETTVVAEVPAEEATDASSDTEALDDSPDVDSAADEEARMVGRAGPIRELPGLSQWADLDLQPFLMEVMLFPEEIPVPDNAILTWVSATQRFRDEGESSWSELNATFQPLFSMEEFKTFMPTLLSDSGWTPSGIDEDLEDHSIRLEFTSDSNSSDFNEIFFTYTDGDTSKQADLRMYASGDIVAGRSEVVVNEALFPWVNDIVVDPAMVNNFVTYDIGRLTGKSELDRRWTAPVTDFERLSDFYRDPSGAVFIADGEMEYSDSIWPSNEIGVLRGDGYDGSITVNQTDPERDVSVLIGGRVLLE